MTPPTVGRIVLVGLRDAERGNNSGRPVAPAIVTAVHSPNDVNVQVFFDGAALEHVRHVLQDTSPEAELGAPREGHWAWPPRVQ